MPRAGCGTRCRAVVQAPHRTAARADGSVIVGRVTTALDYSPSTAREFSGDVAARQRQHRAL